MKADERMAEIRKRLDTERAETITRRRMDDPYLMDIWWEADLKWCLDHIAELERLVPDARELIGIAGLIERWSAIGKVSPDARRLRALATAIRKYREK